MNDSREPDTARVRPPRIGVSFLVSQVGALAAACFGERLAAIGLAPPHAGILRLVGANPGLSQRALSDLLDLFPSQIVPLLDALEQRRLLARRPDDDDRRRYHLYLTAEGRRVLAAIGRLTVALERDLFAALSREERERLSAMLARVVEEQGVRQGVHPAYRQLGRRTETEKGRR